MGSIALCGRNGHWYSLVTTFAAVLNAVSTSPSFLLTWALSPLFISEENNWLWSAVLSIFPSFSYSTFKAFFAFITSHVDLPTTATLFLKVTISVIPGMALAAASFTDLIFVPKAGGRWIIANTIPSR